jgi:hypothetical protein
MTGSAGRSGRRRDHPGERPLTRRVVIKRGGQYRYPGAKRRGWRGQFVVGRTGGAKFSGEANQCGVEGPAARSRAGVSGEAIPTPDSSPTWFAGCHVQWGQHYLVAERYSGEAVPFRARREPRRHSVGSMRCRFRFRRREQPRTTFNCRSNEGVVTSQNFEHLERRERSVWRKNKARCLV